MVSKSPSRQIHFGFSSGCKPKSRINLDNNPSRHSLVAAVIYPYNSCGVMAFGLTYSILVRLPRIPFAPARVLITSVRPHPGGPNKKTQCLIANSSSSCIQRSMKSVSGQSFKFSADPLHASCNVGSILRGGSTPGKRSPNKPKKIGTSCCKIFAVLESRKALIKIAASAISGSARKYPPATRSTDLTALNPQS